MCLVNPVMRYKIVLKFSVVVMWIHAASYASWAYLLFLLLLWDQGYDGAILNNCYTGGIVFNCLACLILELCI